MVNAAPARRYAWPMIGSSPPMSRYRFDQETFVHRDLWYTVHRLAELNTSPETLSRDDAQRAGLMLAACALEGYANFVLSIADPPTFAIERSQFRGQGLCGKLSHVASLVGYPADGSRRPFQTLCQLRDLRDGIAHPRPEQSSDVIEVRADRDPPMFRASLFDQRVRSLTLERVIEDAQAWCDGLQELVRRLPQISSIDRPRLAGPSLRGPTGTSTLSPAR